MPKLFQVQPQGTSLAVVQPAQDGAVVSIAEACELQGVTKRHLMRNMASGQIERVELEAKAANGHAAVGVRVASLSDAAQQAYWAQQRATQDIARARRGAELPALDDGRTPDLATMIANGNAADMDEITRRTYWVGKLLERLVLAKTRDERGVAWRQTAEEAGVSRPTLSRWAAANAESGAIGLAPGRTVRHGHGTRAMSDGCQGAVLAAWNTKQMRNKTQAWKVASQYCSGHKEPAPSRRTVARFLADFTEPLTDTAAREGKTAYMARCATRVVRDIESVGLNEIWCGDGRKLDLFVFGPDGRVIRPWIIVWLDVRTAGIVGWVLRPTINTRAVALALRNGLLTYGCPTILQRDNGHEFVNKYWDGEIAKLDKPSVNDLDQLDRFPAALPIGDWQGTETLLSVLNIGTTTAIPFNPQTKPVESVFNAFFGSFFGENLVPGYCGHDNKKRPEILEQHIKQGKLMRWDQVQNLIAEQIERWNTTHCCGDRTHPPAYYYDRYIPRIPDPALLDVLLDQPAARRITAQGIKIDADHYYNCPELAIHVGKTAKLRWNPDDPRAITAFVPVGPNRVRIAVPLMPKARWGEFGEANLIAQRCRRAQREHCAEVAAEDQLHAAPALTDTYGAFAAVAARIAQEKDETKRAEMAANFEQQAKLAEGAHDIQAEREKAIDQAEQPRQSVTQSRGQAFLDEQRRLRDLESDDQ